MSPKKQSSRPRSTRKPAKRSAGGRSAARLLPEKPTEIVVRMYRQGLGDCFLLAVPVKKGKAKYILIDCGVHARQTDGPSRLAQVLEHVAASTGSHVDVVVATHEHADHLSGFVQKGSPFLKDALTIGELWVAWTEKRGDGQADVLRRKRGTAQRVIDEAVEEAKRRAGAEGVAVASRVLELTDFDRPADGSVDTAAVTGIVQALEAKSRRTADAAAAPLPADLGVAKNKKARKSPSSNELALNLLALKAGAANIEYREPGHVREVMGVSSLRAYVLGPPRSDLLEKDKPSKIRGAKESDPGGVFKEVYLTSTSGNRALELSPRFSRGAAADGGAVPDDWRYPFPPAFRCGCDLSAPVGVGPGYSWNAADMPRSETRSFIEAAYLAEHATWRRIDADWLGSAETLALNLAADTNNTSLALAFEWGPPGKGRVLLFAADAQVGNWLSWRDQTYGTRAMKVDDLLARALLYKVGHHGSHNSTLRRDPRDASSSDPNGAPFGLELMNDIIAMIPVDFDAVKKKMPDPWRMPHEPLYRRLREKSARRVMRSDLELEPLDRGRDLPDLVPRSTKWQPVPGLKGARWRRSKEEFAQGTSGPLCYDVAITIQP